METVIPKPGEIIELPRGGSLVDTSEGYVQVGSPPETIKDTLHFEKGVPAIFCLPREFFSRQKGISVAEIEFPLYYNFFLKKRKTRIVCLARHVETFTVVLKESLFGPEQFNVEADYDENSDVPPPDMKKELGYFRGGMALEHLVEFCPLDEKSEAKLGKIVIRMNAEGNYEILDPSLPSGRAVLPGEVKYHVTFDLGAQSGKPFEPPQFGVTCLGPSHGFDPVDNTSGFLIWINKRGIMVDPPVNTTEWLKRSNVNPKLIDTIILTHTHADHDAGTFQKVLEDEKVTIYTTRTVMDGWLRKYSAMTHMDRKELTKLFNFHPVMIGQKINIHGAWFRFSYTLHALPTIGFRFTYRDKSFIYSSDHLNDPAVFKKLLELGVFSEARYDEMMAFPWESTDYIYHEAGVPPIHTPIAYLRSLPAEVQKRITCYHIARKDFPQDSQLKMATFGIDASLLVDVKEGPYESAFQILDILSRVEIFKNFTIDQAKDLLAVVEKEKIPAGTQIISKGTYGDKFYVILSGSIRIGDHVETEGGESKRYGNYQCFGERSLILGEPRSADVWAETEIEALTISKQAFLNLIAGTELEKNLKHIALSRDADSWDALKATALFPLLTSQQKTDLEIVLRRVEIKEDGLLYRISGIQDNLWVFHSGEAEIIDASGGKTYCKRGEIIGNYKEFDMALPASTECRVKKGTLIFQLESEQFRKYVKKNPGVYLRFFDALMK